jgi:DNA-directed RNA polymerase subunit beta
MMAHNKYSDSLKFNDSDARIKFDDSYLMKHITGKHEHASTSGGTSILDYVAPFSPVDEIMKASKVVRTGRGGLPTKRAAVKAHRNITESYIGNISCNSTTESGDVGLTNHHTLGVLLSNKYGQYGHLELETLKLNDNMGSLAIDEALTPFNSQLDSGRMILARTHANQKIPILKGEPPIIQSGAEYIVPQLASSKFCVKSKDSGKVIDISNDIMTVQYDDGIKEKFDVSSRYSNTKRNSTIKLSFDSLKVGDTFSKSEVIAWSKVFKKDVLANGRNIKIALMNYNGISFEDGYCITEETAENFKTEVIVKIPVLIPQNTKILSMVGIKSDTEIGDPLIEFSYIKDSSDYLDEFDILDDDDDDETESLYQSNNKTLRVLSIGGTIEDIKIKVNTKENIDPVLIENWRNQVSKLKYKVKELRTNSDITSIDNLDTSISRVGNFKHKGKVFEGVLVEFYISKTKKLEIGDKMSNRYGAKGVITGIIKDHCGVSEYSGNIDIFLASTGVIGRKNIAMIKEIYLGKIFFFLREMIKTEAKEGLSLDKIKIKILKIYTLLDSSDDKRQVKSLNSLFKNTSDKELISKFRNSEIEFNLIIPPFTTVTFKSIQEAANILSIPLDEKVFISEFNTWTKYKVPVGYTYYSALEQLSSDYESTRSVAGYVGSTGAPTKGKKLLGGQSVGDLDVNSLLTYNANKLLEELMTVRSDNMRAKNQVLSSLRQTGKAYIPENSRQGQTSDLFKTLLLGMGLNINGKF